MVFEQNDPPEPDTDRDGNAAAEPEEAEVLYANQAFHRIFKSEDPKSAFNAEVLTVGSAADKPDEAE